MDGPTKEYKLPDVTVKAIGELVGAVKHYAKCGVAVYDRRRPRKDIINHTALRQHLRAVAREAGRQFIEARITGSEAEPTVYLTVPKHKRLHNIVMLLATAGEASAYAPIHFYETSGRWHFTFKREGIKAFKGWIEQCLTNPIFRVSLRL